MRQWKQILAFAATIWFNFGFIYITWLFNLFFGNTGSKMQFLGQNQTKGLGAA